MTLVHRCFSICSSLNLFRTQMEYLQHFYSSNGFPTKIFWRCVRRFLHRVHHPPLPSFNVPKDIRYLSLPFLGHHSYVLRNSLQSMFKLHFPQMDVRIVLSNKNTIGSMFPTKDKLPLSICSNVIYMYKCEAGDDCFSSYIGSTTRRLKERMCEHMGISFLTGQKLSDPKSSIYDHIEDTGHPISEESFKIIGSCRADDSILILESVLIKYHRPNLNNMNSAYPLQIT